MSNSFKRRKAIQHAIQRISERYGIEIDAEHVLRINQRIWAGEALEFRPASRKGRYLYAALDDGTKLPFVFHDGYHSVVTVLAPDHLRISDLPF